MSLTLQHKKKQRQKLYLVCFRKPYWGDYLSSAYCSPQSTSYSSSSSSAAIAAKAAWGGRFEGPVDG
ncbi:uncharacterized protein N7479_000124 [Penicillium vulpinum]|uniref:uncharacterized protein n=1 Tax=Penicillium vulpinum TaxID=29845 RepID=UPI002546957B|nr:uncharacterized protein N7479_000124 [Penicillium vulpinum]KAJ5970206.1 hypothetical protein N7479_000124 [Penicillium vulpinum]